MDNAITFSNARWLDAANYCCGGGPFGANGARMGTATFDFTGNIPVLTYTSSDEATGVARELVGQSSISFHQLASAFLSGVTARDL